MPDGPAPTPVLSRITTSAPDPEPAASSLIARCHAVERPCTPAPITTYLACSGSAMVVARLVVVGPARAVAGEGVVRISDRGQTTGRLGVGHVDRHLDRRGHRTDAPSRS